MSVADVFLIGGLFVGGWLCWFSYSVQQSHSQLGRLALTVAIGILGVGSVLAATTGLLPLLPGPDAQNQIWVFLLVVTWNLMTAPWFVFALQYTGTRPAISRWWVVTLTLPVLLVPVRIILQLSTLTLPATIISFTATIVFAYALSLVAAGCYLLLRQTERDARFAVRHALSLTLIPVGSLLFWNVASLDTAATTTAGMFLAGTITIGAGLTAARHQYDLFEMTPAVGTLGNNALIEQTDDLMFVVDADETVVQSNQTAAEELGITRSELLESNVGGLVGHGVDELAASETITLETPAGPRQYDPQQSTVTDPHGNTLGSVLSFRDVSDRELRQQRLAVLNRVLRHNLRNRVDVLKSHAEALPADERGHRSSIISAADDIAALGQQAKEIDRFVSADGSSDQVDLTEVIATALDRVEITSVTVATEMPDTAQLITNQRAVTNAIESSLENAVTYAASSVTVRVTTENNGYHVSISDDGPGIPTEELSSLHTGTESPLEHTTGLGLWRLKWAVMTINGHVSFETDNGTTVSIHIPDQGMT